MLQSGYGQFGLMTGSFLALLLAQPHQDVTGLSQMPVAGDFRVVATKVERSGRGQRVAEARG